jgi:hypothetical protein
VRAPLARIAAITGVAVVALIGLWMLQDTQADSAAEPGSASLAESHAAEPGDDRSRPASAATGIDSEQLRLRPPEGGPTVTSSAQTAGDLRARDEPTPLTTLGEPADASPPVTRVLLDSPTIAVGPEADPHLATSSGANRGRSPRRLRLHGLADSK